MYIKPNYVYILHVLSQNRLSIHRSLSVKQPHDKTLYFCLGANVCVQSAFSYYQGSYEQLSGTTG